MKQKSRVACVCVCVCLCVCVFVRMHMWWKNSSAYQVVLSSGVVWWNTPSHSKTPEEMLVSFKSFRLWLQTIWTHCCISENQWHPKSAVFLLSQPFFLECISLKTNLYHLSATKPLIGLKNGEYPRLHLGIGSPRWIWWIQTSRLTKGSQDIGHLTQIQMDCFTGDDSHLPQPCKCEKRWVDSMFRK